MRVNLELRVVFFFFKQKTAYEIRKGDWSSDVCSSDLARRAGAWRHVADAMSLRGELRVVEHVPRAFAALVVEEAPASLALSGSSTARECYELLAGADVDWKDVEVFF